MRYRPSVGFVAWLLMRISGVAILVFLVLHIWGLQHMLSGPDEFNKYIKLYDWPIFHIGETLLLAALIFHGFNGLRIIVIDFGTGWQEQKVLFWIIVGIGAVIFAAGAVPLLVPIF